MIEEKHKPAKKRAYAPPRLLHYGKLESLTRTGLGSGPDLLSGQKRIGDII